MKKVLAIILFLSVGVFLFWKVKQNNTSHESTAPNEQIINLNPMNITSPTFANNQAIPAKYTCDGEGVNPPLEFSDVPSNAQSLALIVDDPDAPVGTWVHWILWNIGTETASIAENSAPEGAVQGKTSSGQNVYGGPCPPNGTHRYFFKLYALDTKFSIPSFSLSGDLEKAMQGHILAQAQLVGLYNRNK